MAIEYVDSTQLDAALGYTADRIRAKDGSSALKPFDLAGGKGFGDAIDAIPSGGGETDGNIADFIRWTPAFDDTWTVIEFDLISYPSNGIMTLPNPLGVIPTYIVALKDNPTLSDVGGVIGGFNFISGAATDADTNRNISFQETSPSGSTNLTEFGMFGNIGYNNWNFISAACNVTANQIQFRCGKSKGKTAGFVLGHYIMGVKVV